MGARDTQGSAWSKNPAATWRKCDVHNIYIIIYAWQTWEIAHFAALAGGEKRVEAHHHARPKRNAAVRKARKANVPPTFILLPPNFKDQFGKICMPDNCLTPLKPHKSRATQVQHHLAKNTLRFAKLAKPMSPRTLVSIPFQRLIWKDPQIRHPSNSTKVSQVSNTTGTPLDSILFHRFEAWSHRPPCQAPGLGSFIANVTATQVDLRNRFVDFQCFGKGLWTKRWQTMSNLRTYKAICDTTIKPCPPPKIRSQDHESKSRWISAKIRYCSILVLDFVSSFTSVRAPSPVSLSSCFHPISMTLLERSTGPRPNTWKPVQQH